MTSWYIVERWRRLDAPLEGQCSWSSWQPPQSCSCFGSLLEEAPLLTLWTVLIISNGHWICKCAWPREHRVWPTIRPALDSCGCVPYNTDAILRRHTHPMLQCGPICFAGVVGLVIDRDPSRVPHTADHGSDTFASCREYDIPIPDDNPRRHRRRASFDND